MDIVSKITGNTLSATEFNQIPTELENLITSSSQTVSDAVLNQDTIAVSRYAANNFYIDSGTADNYVLTLASSFTNPVSATVGYFVGMTIRFRAGNAGTGGAAIVNVGGAGDKSLKEADGTTNPTSIPTTIDTEWRYDGTVFRKVNLVVAATESAAGIAKLPKQITIANNATDANNDIDFSAGNFIVSDGSAQGYAASIETKRLDATWAAGNNAGGLAAGLTKTNLLWYHCFKLLNPTTGVTGSGYDTSVNATNLLADAAVISAGFTKYAWRNAIFVNSSGNIESFKQDGRTITFAPVAVFNNTLVGTTFSTFTPRAPTGIRVKCLLSGVIDGGSAVNGMIVKDKISGFQKQVIYADSNDGGGEFFQFCDLSPAIDIAKSAVTTLDDFIVYSIGWEIPDNLY